MPAAALVPNLTPTSHQSRPAETTPKHSMKADSKPAEADMTGSTRDPSPSPAHKVQPAGPRSTPSPSSPSSAKNDPPTPKTSSDLRSTQDVKTHSQPNGSQAPISSETASKIHISSEKAIYSSIQELFKDESSKSRTRSEIAAESLDIFHPSRVSPHLESDQKSTPSPNAVILNLLSTIRGLYEAGASVPMTVTTQSKSSEDRIGHDRSLFDPNAFFRHGSSLQESKYPQGTTTAGDVSPRLHDEMVRDNTRASGSSPDQVKTDTDRPSLGITSDPPAAPISNASAVRNPGFGSKIRSSTLEALTYNHLSNDQGNQQPQLSSPDSIAEEDSAFNTQLLAGKSSLGVKPGPSTQDNLKGTNSITRPDSDTLKPAALTALKEVLSSTPNPSLYSPATTTISPTRSKAISNIHDASAAGAASTLTASKENPDLTAGPLLSPAVHSSDFPVLADANTSGNPQYEPLNSIKAALGNRTAFPSDPSDPSAAGRRGPVSSSVSTKAREKLTGLPYKNGDGRTTAFSVKYLCAYLASVYLWWLVSRRCWK